MKHSHIQIEKIPYNSSVRKHLLNISMVMDTVKGLVEFALYGAYLFLLFHFFLKLAAIGKLLA